MAAALVPLLVLVRVWLPVADDLDVPYWDQWEFVPLIDAARAGTLGLGDLFRQDGETRPFVHRAVIIALARATAWDTRAEIVLTLALGAITVASIVGLLLITVRPWRPWLVPPLALAASATCLSLAAYEAWLWGWSFGTGTAGAMTTFAVWALAWRDRRVGAWLATLAAVAAALSFTTGLVALGLVPVGLALDPRRFERATTRWMALGAGAVGVATVVLYFTGFAYPQRLSVPGAFANPGAVGEFFLAYLGAPFGARSAAVGAVSGGAGLVVAVGAGAWLWGSQPSRRAALWPWVLLGGFGLVAAGMAAIGRWHFGAGHALTSRYQTFSTLFWVAAVALGALALTEVGVGSSRRRLIALASGGAAACLLVTGYLATWIATSEPWSARVEALRRGRECVVFHPIAPAECLALIYPDVPVVRARAARLETLGLGPFRPGARVPALAAYPASDERRPVGSVDAVHVSPALLVNPVSAAYRATEIVVVGRAIDPGTGRPPRGVLVVVDGTVAGRAEPDARGFTFRFGAFRLSPGPHTIEGYAILADGRIARLSRGWSIAVPARS